MPAQRGDSLPEEPGLTAHRLDLKGGFLQVFALKLIGYGFLFLAFCVSFLAASVFDGTMPIWICFGCMQYCFFSGGNQKTYKILQVLHARRHRRRRRPHFATISRLSPMKTSLLHLPGP